MKDITGGATIFSHTLATRLREVEKFDSDLIHIIQDLEELEAVSGDTFSGDEQLPYFGAILTKKGERFIQLHFNKNSNN